MSRWFLAQGAALWAFIALAVLQFGTDHLVDRDSYYHARYAQLMPERGLSREFPWAQESVWSDRFSDKEFLFHVLLAPFCRGTWVIPGAKGLTWMLGCAVIGVLLLILTKHQVRWPWLWIALVPALGNHFLFRLQYVRPQLLSLLLLLLGIHVMLSTRWKWLALVGFLYSWSYSAPHLLVAFAILDALARRAVDGRFEWRGVAWAAGGVVGGLLFHPYFPNDLHMWWIMNVQIMTQAWGLGGDIGARLGVEFDGRSLTLASSGAFLCFIGTLAATALADMPLSRRSRLMICYMLGGFGLYCMSSRFVEYFAPLALLAAASVTSDLWPVTAWTRARAGVAAAAAVAFIGLTVFSMGNARTAVKNYPGPDVVGACRWMKENIPPNETVVHLEWGDFVQLFHFDPTHRYLVGLDSMFMYVRSKEKLQLIEQVLAGRRPLVAQELGDVFKSNWLILRARHRRLAERVGLQPEYEDAGASVYRLRN